MSEISEANGVVIDFYESVPSFTGITVIRLPRCANCFDEVHDYSFGKAFCIPSVLAKHGEQQRYARMGAEQLRRWEEAEREEQARREREAK